MLQTYVGRLIPGTNRIIRLNWAGFGLGKEREGDYSLFVRDMGPEVSDYMLQQHFQVSAACCSCLSAREGGDTTVTPALATPKPFHRSTLRSVTASLTTILL